MTASDLSFPLVEVPSPKRAEPAIGTLMTTCVPEIVETDRWELGYQFRTGGACLPAYRWGPCSGATKISGGGSRNVEQVPITVYAPFRCSTFGYREDEYLQSAIDALTWSGGTVLEAELWDGQIALQNGWPNMYLADPLNCNLVGNGDTYPSMVALALLQKEMRACIGEGNGTIHASPALVSIWNRARSIETVDGQLRDLFGNYVIAGSGYSGGGLVDDAVYTIDSTGSGGHFHLLVTSPITGVTEATSNIAHDASAALIETRLEALAIINVGDVTVTGGAMESNPVVITFGGRFVGQEITLVNNTVSITGGTMTTTVTNPGGSFSADPTVEWAYGTGTIDTYIGDVEVIDPAITGSIDRSTNTVEFIAEASMSAVWDSCCLFGVAASLNPAASWPT